MTMPFKHARFKHFRQLPPGKFKKVPGKPRFYTVPVGHTNYTGKKFSDSRIKARTGVLRKTGKWEVQSFLVPKGVSIE